MPSKKKVKAALDALMSAPGTPDDIWDDLLGTSDPKARLTEAFAGTKKYDDRAAALVFQSMLEKFLELAIAGVMKVPQKKMPDLFGYDEEKGPSSLATFNAKIIKGVELGLYDDLMAADLRMIKKIRNVFAHARVHVDFQHEAMKDACEAMHVVKNLKAVGIEVGHRGKAWHAKLLTTRQRYIGAIAVLTDLLGFYTHLPITDAAIIVRYGKMYNRLLEVPTN